jgi:hypothetical protein
MTEYNDLLNLLDEVMVRVPDSRFVWCVAADGFETTVSHRRGLVLGGAWSPHFLRDASDLWWDVPWTMRLWAPRVITIDKADMPLAQWLPLMEAVAKAGESLLIVTRDASSELLQTIIVNSLKKTLSGCIIRAAQNLSGYAPPATGIPWNSVNEPAKTNDRLPQVAEAWVRRSATVLFPKIENEWQSLDSEVTIISVGGENHEDQIDRLRFLVKRIQQYPDAPYS